MAGRISGKRAGEGSAKRHNYSYFRPIWAFQITQGPPCAGIHQMPASGYGDRAHAAQLRPRLIVFSAPNRRQRKARGASVLVRRGVPSQYAIFTSVAYTKGAGAVCDDPRTEFQIASAFRTRRSSNLHSRQLNRRGGGGPPPAGGRRRADVREGGCGGGGDCD